MSAPLFDATRHEALRGEAWSEAAARAFWGSITRDTALPVRDTF